MDPSLKAGLFIAVSLALVIAVLALLARWGRRRSKGAVAVGAIFSMFAPDPTLERNIRLAEEAKQEQCEEDEEGENKDPVQKKR